jgi:hypothetical protein
MDRAVDDERVSVDVCSAIETLGPLGWIIFASRYYRESTPVAAFPQEKPPSAALAQHTVRSENALIKGSRERALRFVSPALLLEGRRLYRHRRLD